MDVLVSGAVDGVGGAMTQLQPLTVEQERHKTVEQVSVNGREARTWIAVLCW